MSPLGRSTLITSAPNHASSWVQVGPDCTWVISRIRMPSSAFMASPRRQCGLPARGLFVHGLRLGAGRVFVGIHPDVDHRRLAAGLDLLARTAQRRADLVRLGDLIAELLPITAMYGAPNRLAVSMSNAVMPKEPSP